VDVLCIDNSLVKQKQLDRITWVRESRDKKMVKTLVFIITKITRFYGDRIWQDTVNGTTFNIAKALKTLNAVRFLPN
jgi:hypothetical protein